MGYFLKSTCDLGHLRGDMGHGSCGDRGQRYFWNFTCDMGTPYQGPLWLLIERYGVAFCGGRIDHAFTGNKVGFRPW